MYRYQYRVTLKSGHEYLAPEGSRMNSQQTAWEDCVVFDFEHETVAVFLRSDIRQIVAWPVSGEKKDA